MSEERERYLAALAEKTLAEAEAQRVEAQKAEAEARKLAAEARAAEVQAELAEINRDRERTKRQEELAADRFHHVYAFNGQIASDSVKRCIDQLTIWMRTNPGCDIEIVFNSPGGSVIDGMALFDFIQLVKERGHKVTTAALGMAASMAGILLQAGTVRIMGREAWLLIHEAQFGAGGSMGQVEDTVEWVKKIHKRIVRIFASRSKLTEKQIEKRWKRKDWWLSSEEAEKLGLVDGVR